LENNRHFVELNTKHAQAAAQTSAYRGRQHRFAFQGSV
jgi:hypothetical protein